MAYGGGAKGGASRSSESRSSESRSSESRSSESRSSESRSSESRSRSSPDHGGYGGPGDSSSGGASAGAGHGGIGGLGGESRGGYGGDLRGAVLGGYDDIGDWGTAFGTEKDFKDPSDAIGEALRSYHANPHALAPDSLAKAYDLGLVDVTGRLAPEARDYHLTDATMFGTPHPTKPGQRQANIRDIPLTMPQQVASVLPSLLGLSFLAPVIRDISRVKNYNQAREHFPGLPEVHRTPSPIDPGDGFPYRPAPPAPPAPPASTPPKWSSAYKKLYESLYGKTDGTKTDGNQSILSLYREMFAEEES